MLGPSLGIFEWDKFSALPKKPYAFELSSGGTFAFAGLWDAWKDREGHRLQSFAIVTTEANELMAPTHPRMPVIFTRESTTAGWMGRDGTTAAGPATPLRVGAMETYEANPKVGNAEQRPGADASGGGSSRAWGPAVVMRKRFKQCRPEVSYLPCIQLSPNQASKHLL